MKKAGIIIKKELFRVFGDRKMIFSLFVFPAIIVIAIYGLMGVLIGNMASDIEEHISNVVIVNATDSVKTITATTGYDKMADVAWMTEQEFKENEEGLKDDILNGSKDLIVYFDENFEAEAVAYSKQGDKVPVMKIYYNSTESYSSQARSVYAAVVSESLKTSVLSNRFGNMELLVAFDEQDENICKEEKANSEFISMMLPYMIVMLLFSGVMSIGVDAIAGEKERGTLASMLISPASRKDIVVGKLVSMSILAGLSSLVYSGAMVIAMPIMGSSYSEMTSMGFGSLSLSAPQIIELIVIMLVLVYLYVGIVGFLAALAKDVKSATAFISPINIVVIVCGMLTMFTSGKEVPTTRYAIPVYGSAMAIKDICSNELTLVNFGATIAGTLVIGIIFTAAIVKAFNSEKVMFNA